MRNLHSFDNKLKEGKNEVRTLRFLAFDIFSTDLPEDIHSRVRLLYGEHEQLVLSSCRLSTIFLSHPTPDEMNKKSHCQNDINKCISPTNHPTL